MRFGPVPVAEAVGAIAAHGVQARSPEGEAVTLRKGDVVTATHVAALGRAGVRSIVVARLDPGDGYTPGLLACDLLERASPALRALFAG